MLISFPMLAHSFYCLGLLSLQKLLFFGLHTRITLFNFYYSLSANPSLRTKVCFGKTRSVLPLSLSLFSTLITLLSKSDESAENILFWNYDQDCPPRFLLILIDQSFLKNPKQAWSLSILFPVAYFYFPGVISLKRITYFRNFSVSNFWSEFFDKNAKQPYMNL